MAAAVIFTTRHALTSATAASYWFGTATATFCSWEYRLAWWTTRPQGRHHRCCPVSMRSTLSTVTRSLTSASTRRQTVRVLLVYFATVHTAFGRPLLGQLSRPSLVVLDVIAYIYSQLGPSSRSTMAPVCLQMLAGTDPVSLWSWSVQRARGRPGRPPG